VGVADELLMLKDSLLDKDKAKSLLGMQVVFETEKKEQQIHLLEQDNVVNQQEIENKNIWIYGLIMTITLVTIICILIYVGYRASQRNKRRVETLLKELHHRVKNNLQILSSVLSLQSQYLKDEDALQAIKSSESRVNAMALIHKKLYRDDGNRTIDMKEYIQELGAYLLHTYGYTENRVRLVVESETIAVDVDKAIPIGLMLNELMSNALKYAFKSQAEPVLLIELKLLKSATLTIAVRDNGSGMDQQKMQSGTVSFGLKMVHTLIRELKGKLDITSQNGTAFLIQLPL
jgi:two-component sensor histidine kinase